MNVAINRDSALRAIFAFELDNKKEFRYWENLGIKYLERGDSERWYFEIINKELLMWSMLKYGFEIELYSNL